MTPRVKVSSALEPAGQHMPRCTGEDIHPNSVSINDTEVINSNGQWVGDPTGLRGPQGEQGAQGEPGVPGVAGEIGPAGPGFDVWADTDNDGFTDWLEVIVGTEPTDESSVPADADDDGVPDILRGQQGFQGDQGIQALKETRATKVFRVFKALQVSTV